MTGPADTEPADYIVHMLMGAAGPRCGAVDPGPIPFGAVRRIMCCQECMAVDGGLPHAQTMRGHLERTRANLDRKLRQLSDADRAAWKEQIIAAATASLVDPDCRPPMFTEAELLAALYALSSVAGAYNQLRRAGVRPTWALLDEGIRQLDMIFVAQAEGMPR